MWKWEYLNRTTKQSRGYFSLGISSTLTKSSKIGNERNGYGCSNLCRFCGTGSMSDQCKGLRSPATGRLLFFALIQWKSCCGRKIRNAAELYCVLWTAHGNFEQCQNCFGYELWGGGRLASILNSHRRITPKNWSNRQKDSPAIPSPTAGLSFQRRNRESTLSRSVHSSCRLLARTNICRQIRFFQYRILHTELSETALPANRTVTRFLLGF